MGAYTPTTQPRMRTDEDAMRPCAHTMHARMTHSAHACECNKHPQPEPQQDAPALALRDSCCSNTALHYAAIYGHGDVVALLLSHGAAVNKQANDGYANRTSMPAAMHAHTCACAHTVRIQRSGAGAQRCTTLQIRWRLCTCYSRQAPTHPSRTTTGTDLSARITQISRMQHRTTGPRAHHAPALRTLHAACCMAPRYVFMNVSRARTHTQMPTHTHTHSHTHTHTHTHTPCNHAAT